jgi:hypothetical protein
MAAKPRQHRVGQRHKLVRFGRILQPEQQRRQSVPRGQIGGVQVEPIQPGSAASARSSCATMAGSPKNR